MTYKFAILTLFAWSSICFAANTFENEQAAIKLAESAMVRAAKGDYPGAMAILAPYAVASESDLQGIALQLKANRARSAEQFGPAGSYEFVSDTRVGSSIWRVIFLEKGARRGMLWKFTYYKSQTGWLINSVDVTDNINKEF